MYLKCRYLKQRTKKGQLYYYCSKTRQIVQKGCYRGCLDKEYKSNTQKPIKRTPIKVKPKKYQTSQETYNKVFERCSGKCALCLKTFSSPDDYGFDLHCHHIKGRGRYLTDNPDNCIFLCDHCHNEVVHKNNKYWRPILLKIVELQNGNKYWYEEPR